MPDIKPGIYAFSNPRSVHYICGRAYSGGSMVVTSSLSREAYVERLVAAGALKYVGAAPPEDPQPSQPKLINRSAPSASDKAPEKTVDSAPASTQAQQPGQSGNKNKDKK